MEEKFSFMTVIGILTSVFGKKNNFSYFQGWLILSVTDWQDWQWDSGNGETCDLCQVWWPHPGHHVGCHWWSGVWSHTQGGQGHVVRQGGDVCLLCRRDIPQNAEGLDIATDCAISDYGSGVSWYVSIRYKHIQLQCVAFYINVGFIICRWFILI